MDYKEKIKAAKEILKEADAIEYNLPDSAHAIRTTVYSLFPELKESEDERIKDLIGKALCGSKLRSEEVQDVLAWLEKPCEQKPAEWSEEDKNMIYKIRNMIFKYAFSQSAVDVNGYLCEKEYIEADGWMESLRCQNTWKPSDEQMEALTDAMDKYCGMYKATLCSLYNNLKEKLKR